MPRFASANLAMTENARHLKTKLGGRILEVESVLFKPRAEIRLDCLSHKRGAEIADSSPKANAPN
ncbi:hypothetical protein [Helicobacter canis]|uniref:Uncharacterized protein n=1 Tax=Helicobacter canis TaxID=29419 RepID=A0A5M9QRV1_9HELI|nr:hypothetical protein [Helicobacter canis]KAA8711130.1 hypothetical protein F4V45_01225 [Helicobacter canis]